MAFIDTHNVEYTDDCKVLVKAPKEIEGEYVVRGGVTTIKSSAFSGCEKLTAIHLPSSFIKAEINAFTNCKSLKKVTSVH